MYAIFILRSCEDKTARYFFRFPPRACIPL